MTKKRPTDRPGLRNGKLLMGAARAGNGHGPRGIDSKTERLIQAMTCGITEDVSEGVCGIIPGGVPLTLQQAARVVNMKQKRARLLETTPVFTAALKAANESLRECEDPANFAVALAIRDNPKANARARLAAIDHIRGPEPITATLVAKGAPPRPPPHPGYIIGRPPLAHTTAQVAVPAAAASIIPAPRVAKVGDVAHDFAKERAEAAKPRPSRG